MSLCKYIDGHDVNELDKGKTFGPFQDFQGPQPKFKDFPGPGIFFCQFQDFPGFSRSVATLYNRSVTKPYETSDIMFSKRPMF